MVKNFKFATQLVRFLKGRKAMLGALDDHEGRRIDRAKLLAGGLAAEKRVDMAIDKTAGAKAEQC
jgi:hypothetical protein